MLRKDDIWKKFPCIDNLYNRGNKEIYVWRGDGKELNFHGLTTNLPGALCHVMSPFLLYYVIYVVDKPCFCLYVNLNIIGN